MNRPTVRRGAAISWKLQVISPAAAMATKDSESKGAPSVLYLVDNIPNGTSVSRLIAHFQKRKKHKGGEVVEEECKSLGPDSALLMFENASGKAEVTPGLLLHSQTTFFFRQWVKKKKE